MNSESKTNTNGVHIKIAVSLLYFLFPKP